MTINKKSVSLLIAFGIAVSLREAVAEDSPKWPREVQSALSQATVDGEAAVEQGEVDDDGSSAQSSGASCRAGQRLSRDGIKCADAAVPECSDLYASDSPRPSLVARVRAIGKCVRDEREETRNACRELVMPTGILRLKLAIASSDFCVVAR